MKLINGILALAFLPLIVVGYASYIAYCSLLLGWSLAEATGDKAERDIRNREQR
jgi:hypothetical protein